MIKEKCGRRFDICAFRLRQRHEKYVIKYSRQSAGIPLFVNMTTQQFAQSLLVKGVQSYYLPVVCAAVRCATTQFLYVFACYRALTFYWLYLFLRLHMQLLVYCNKGCCYIPISVIQPALHAVYYRFVCFHINISYLFH